MNQLVKEKVEQAIGILNELDIDLWMLVGRETSTLCDPSIPIVVGMTATWPSAFLIPARARRTQSSAPGTNLWPSVARGGGIGNLISTARRASIALAGRSRSH
jgi:hypothetical protein